METIYADKTVNVTELKRDFAAILDAAKNDVVAILNHNKPEVYLIPATVYERLLERLEDAEDAKTVHDRAAGPFVEVDARMFIAPISTKTNGGDLLD